jgi:hypothetical protein
MANDYSGRIWKITGAGTTPFGTANVKFKGGTWTGAVAAQTFIITDVAGRAFQWTFPADGSAVNFQELGWMSGPLTFSGTFTGEVNLYLGTK